MTVLDRFIEEMLQPEMPKTAFIEKLIHALTVQRPPRFEIPAPPYTFASNLHGLQYDYVRREVRLVYKVVPSIYADTVLPFTTFRVILEGLAVCIRMQKW